MVCLEQNIFFYLVHTTIIHHKWNPHFHEIPRTYLHDHHHFNSFLKGLHETQASRQVSALELPPPSKQQEVSPS